MELCNMNSLRDIEKKLANAGFVALEPPPSANLIWRLVSNQHGRVRNARSQKYLNWMARNAYTAQQGLKRFTGVEVRVELLVLEGRQGLGFRLPNDLDNVIKPIIDCLVQSGRLETDSRRVVRSIVVNAMKHPVKSANSAVWVAITTFVPPRLTPDCEVTASGGEWVDT